MRQLSLLCVVLAANAFHLVADGEVEHDAVTRRELADRVCDSDCDYGCECDSGCDHSDDTGAYFESCDHSCDDPLCESRPSNATECACVIGNGRGKREKCGTEAECARHLLYIIGFVVLGCVLCSVAGYRRRKLAARTAAGHGDMQTQSRQADMQLTYAAQMTHAGQPMAFAQPVMAQAQAVPMAQAMPMAVAQPVA